MQTNVSSNVICKLLLRLLVVHTIRKALQKCCNKLQKNYSLYIRDQPTMNKIKCSTDKNFFIWVLHCYSKMPPFWILWLLFMGITKKCFQMLENAHLTQHYHLSSLVLTLPLLKELTLGVKLASSQKKMEIGDATQNYDPPVSPLSHTLTLLVLLILFDAKL